MQYYYDQSMMDGGFGGWGIFMMLFWVILIVIIVLVVARLLNHRHDGTPHRKVDHLDIIKERYAKGDITKDQFEQLKKDLK